MAKAIFPGIGVEEDYVRQAHVILDDMVSKGNRIAEVREMEVSRLESLCNEFAARAEELGLQTLILPCPDDSQSGCETNTGPINFYFSMDELDPDVGESASSLGGARHTQQQALGNMAFLDDIGISSDNFLTIVDQMGSVDDMTG